ncbi:MAG: heme exporter protein CcmD [Gammaproteobacteria bacterium]
MGKYSFHVWSVYGLFAVFVFVNLFKPLMQRRQFIREQRQKALRDKQIAQQSLEQERVDALGEGNEATSS